MAPRKLPRRRWWVWGLAVLGGVTFLHQALSILAFQAFVRELEGDRSVLTSPFYDGSNWVDPSTCPPVSVMGPVPPGEMDAVLRRLSVQWSPMEPLDRFIFVADSGGCMSGSIVLRMRLGAGGWKRYALHEALNPMFIKPGDDDFRYVVPRLRFAAWNGRF